MHPDGQDLNHINLFLVHDIRNKATQDLIAEALKTYKVPEGQKRATKVPMWPGLTFNTDTEEGAAMLGKCQTSLRTPVLLLLRLKLTVK